MDDKKNNAVFTRIPDSWLYQAALINAILVEPPVGGRHNSKRIDGISSGEWELTIHRSSRSEAIYLRAELRRWKQKPDGSWKSWWCRLHVVGCGKDQRKLAEVLHGGRCPAHVPSLRESEARIIIGPKNNSLHPPPPAVYSL